MILLAMAIPGCTIRIDPLPPKPAAKVYKKKYTANRKQIKSRPAAKEKFIIVDAEWIANYTDLKKIHGHYDIPSDRKIEIIEGGKFRVPSESVKHFRDLTLSPVTPAPPTTTTTPMPFNTVPP